MKWLYFGICLLCFAFLPDVAYGSGGAKGGLLDPQPGLAIWTIITFTVLLVLLKKLAWKPMIDALEKREEHIRNAVETAEKSQEQAKKLLEEANQKLEKANKEAKEIFEAAQQKATELQRNMLAEARQETTRLKEQAQTQILRAKEKAMEELWELLGNASAEITHQLIGKSLDQPEHLQLINQAVKDIRKRKEAS